MASIVAKRGLGLSNGFEDSTPPRFAKRSCVRPDYAPLEPNNQSVWAPSGEPVPSAHTRDVVTSLQNSGLLSENSASLLLSRPPSFWNEEERAWFAVGELNLMFPRQSFSQIPLLSSHSFTRSTRPAVFAKLCSSQCVYPQHVMSNPSQSPHHLRVVLDILDKAYCSFSEASVAVSSFHVPAWLQEWCSRWGFPSSSRARMTMYAVNAYPNYYQPIGLGTQPPVQTLLVPDFTLATTPIH